MLGTALQSLYALIDLAFVGRLGAVSVAGLSISLQAFFLVLAAAQIIAAAALARISRLYGADEIESARRAHSAYVVVAVCAGCVVAAIAWLTAPIYVAAFTDDPAVFAEGLIYFRVNAATYFSQLLLIVIGTGFRASGDFRTPVKVMAASVLVNLALDPILIFGMGPVPALGLAGAAWATVIAQAIGLTVYLWLAGRPGDERALRWRRPALSVDMVREIFTLGLPAGLQHLLLSAVLGIVLTAVKSHGPAWTAAAGGGFRIVQQTILPVVAISFAASALAGQNLGARLPDRIVRTSRVAVGAGLVYGLIVGLLLFVFARTAGLVFATGAEQLDVAETYFRWSALLPISFAASLIPARLMQGVGAAMPALAAALVKVAVLWIAVVVLVPALDLAPAWIFGSMTAAALVEGAIDIVMLWVVVARLPRTLAGETRS